MVKIVSCIDNQRIYKYQKRERNADFSWNGEMASLVKVFVSQAQWPESISRNQLKVAETVGYAYRQHNVTQWQAILDNLTSSRWKKKKKTWLRNNTQGYPVISTYLHTNKPPTPPHKQACHSLMHFTVPPCLSHLFTADSLHNSSNFLQTRYKNVLWFSNNREVDHKYEQWRVALKFTK